MIKNGDVLACSWCGLVEIGPAETVDSNVSKSDKEQAFCLSYTYFFYNKIPYCQWTEFMYFIIA